MKSEQLNRAKAALEELASDPDARLIIDDRDERTLTGNTPGFAKLAHELVVAAEGPDGATHFVQDGWFTSDTNRTEFTVLVRRDDPESVLIPAPTRWSIWIGRTILLALGLILVLAAVGVVTTYKWLFS